MGRPKKDWTGSKCGGCAVLNMPLTKSGQCRKCYAKAYDKAKYDANPAAHIEKVKHWARNNRDKVRKNHNASYARHASTRKITNAVWTAANPERVKADKKAWHGRRKLHVQALQASKKYRISYSEYIALRESQGGLCACCGGLMKPPCLDHNHTTGSVRKFLCHHCNVVVGHIEKKGPEVVHAAIAYIQKHTFKEEQ